MDRLFAVSALVVRTTIQAFDRDVSAIVCSVEVNLLHGGVGGVADGGEVTADWDSASRLSF